MLVCFLAPFVVETLVQAIPLDQQIESAHTEHRKRRDALLVGQTEEHAARRRWKIEATFDAGDAATASAQCQF